MLKRKHTHHQHQKGEQLILSPTGFNYPPSTRTSSPKQLRNFLCDTREKQTVSGTKKICFRHLPNEGAEREREGGPPPSSFHPGPDFVVQQRWWW